MPEREIAAHRECRTVIPVVSTCRIVLGFSGINGTLVSFDRQRPRATRSLRRQRVAGIFRWRYESDYSFLFLRKDALDQVLEPRIAPERLEPSVDLDTAEDASVEDRALFVALFQEPQRFLLIAQRQVDKSE